MTWLLLAGMGLLAAVCIVVGVVLDRRAEARSRWTKW